MRQPGSLLTAALDALAARRDARALRLCLQASQGLTVVSRGAFGWCRGQIHNGTWYMYYIVGGECPGRWVAYAYATSTDGVHWQDQGDMLYASQTGEEQSCANAGYALGSGWVWQSPATGKWLVDYSQSNRLAGPGQSIFFAEADTPVGPWRNISGQKSWDFRPDAKNYEWGGRWDTIRVVPKEAPAEGFCPRRPGAVKRP